MADSDFDTKMKGGVVEIFFHCSATLVLTLTDDIDSAQHVKKESIDIGQQK